MPDEDDLPVKPEFVDWVRDELQKQYDAVIDGSLSRVPVVEVDFEPTYAPGESEPIRVPGLDGASVSIDVALTPEATEAIQQAVDDADTYTVPTMLVWADELHAGMVIVTEECDHPNANPLYSLFSGQEHRKRQAFSTIHKIRQEGGIVSAIVIDEDGEQQGAAWQTWQPVRVRAD